MKKVVICVLAAAAVLSACSNVTKEKLGLSKKAPDEFMVVPQAPLSLPPEYDYSPVAVQLQEIAEPAVAEDLTPAEQALMKRIRASGGMSAI